VVKRLTNDAIHDSPLTLKHIDILVEPYTFCWGYSKRHKGNCIAAKMIGFSMAFKEQLYIVFFLDFIHIIPNDSLQSWISHKNKSVTVLRKIF